MKYFCTLSDKKYLLQGLALHQSLCKNEDNFVLYYLCMDNETYEFLLNYKSDAHHIIYPIALDYLEHKDADLLKAKSNPPCLYGNQHSQYCWALTPYFMNFCLKNFVPASKQLMYIDSDIYFYYSTDIIFKDIADKSIGIHSHRGESKYDPLKNPVGEFNVGVVVIRNNEIGMQCSEWWKNCLLDTNNPHYKVYGTCGDQKYLDLFIPLFKDVCVFDRLNSGYIAPWCFDNIEILANKRIVYKGIKQPVVFYHFSHFNYDINKVKWNDSYNGEWKPSSIPAIAEYYHSYYRALTNINKSIQC